MVGWRSFGPVCFMVSLVLPATASAWETYPLMELNACPTLETAQAQARNSKLFGGRPHSEYTAANVAVAGCGYSQVAITTVDPQPVSGIFPFITWSDAVDENGPYPAFVAIKENVLP
jgi:hypothetical protein